MALVVKNGSKIRSRIAGSMPQPVSATSIRTPCPSGSARVRIVTVPSAAAGVDAVHEQVDDDLVNPRRATANRGQRLELGDETNTLLAGVALDHVDR